jgi:hypothetical protein
LKKAIDTLYLFTPLFILFIYPVWFWRSDDDVQEEDYFYHRISGSHFAGDPFGARRCGDGHPNGTSRQA